MGNSIARADDFECLDWNKNVPHIMATGSNGGFVTVWDVKTKKESLTLNNLSRKAVSAIAWDPDKVLGGVRQDLWFLCLLNYIAYSACYCYSSRRRSAHTSVGLAEF